MENITVVRSDAVYFRFVDVRVKRYGKFSKETEEREERVTGIELPIICGAPVCKNKQKYVNTLRGEYDVSSLFIRMAWMYTMLYANVTSMT